MKKALRPQLLLIDGSAQMYRAYHALTGLTGPDGQPTNAVYGFVTMLRKLLDDQKPDYVAAAFDLSEPTFREEIDPNYKANRAATPDDLVEQIPWIHEACEALGVPVFTLAGYEADDVIGTLTRQASNKKIDVVIVTSDKDFFQLVNKNITVFNPRDHGTWYDIAGVEKKFGVRPDQVIDVLALMGDAVDNVKGVPGIGEKGARTLIGKHGSLDDLLEHPEEIAKPSHRTALTEHADLARQSRALVTINTEAPIDLDLEHLQFVGPSQTRCFDLFSKLGFRKLIAEYAPNVNTIKTSYRAITTSNDLRSLSNELLQAKRFAVYVLTDTSIAMRAEIIGLAFSTTPQSGYYVPCTHTSLELPVAFRRTEALEILKPALENPASSIVGHDLKWLSIVLRRHGIQLAKLTDDTMLASYVLDSTRSTHRIENAALDTLTYQAITDESIRGKGAKTKSFTELPLEVVLSFAAERADLILQIMDAFKNSLERESLSDVYRNLELPLIQTLVDIEVAGVRIDSKQLKKQSNRLESKLSKLSDRIYELAGEAFNINSPKQLGGILFEKLKLPTLKRTGKTKVASTAVDVLEELAITHELPQLVLDWRSLQKLKSTYLDALPQLVHPETGRLHTSFNQAVAATGRLSSSEPNLQNIPIRTELGREIRQTFIADPGNVLISADYSQIELRVLAHLSEDATLIKAFQRGDDIHDQTALKIFGSESTLDPKELRRRAKIVNYALLYGKTAFTLAKDIGVTQQAAQQFIEAYFAGFPAVRQFIDKTLDAARDNGVVQTMFGRRRLVPNVNSRNGQVRAAAEREAVNMPIQGSAADILKRAMIDIQRELTSGEAVYLNARMILTVHDELLFEVKEAAADALASIVRNRMEQAVPLRVPVIVDLGIGPNWKEAKT